MHIPTMEGAGRVGAGELLNCSVPLACGLARGMF